MLFYGGIGWVVDRWLGTGFWVVIGILLGAGLGIYMTFARFGSTEARTDRADEAEKRQAEPRQERE